MCTEVMDYMPLGVVIDNRVLCVHGGLSPSFTNLDELKNIDRK